MFHRRAKTQADEAEQQKLKMETFAERLDEANKKADLAEKGFEIITKLDTVNYANPTTETKS